MCGPHVPLEVCSNIAGSGSELITDGITNGSTLVFSPVEFGDEGCYQCVPQLQEGSTTFSEAGTLEMCVNYIGKIVPYNIQMLELSDSDHTIKIVIGH